MAAICVRDHLDELTTAEISWCQVVLCRDLQACQDPENRPLLVPPQGTAAAAFVISKIFPKVPPEPTLTGALAIALTHPEHSVRIAACEGVSRYLWDSPKLAEAALRLLVEHAAFEAQYWEAIRTVQFGDRSQFETKQRQILSSLRQRFRPAEDWKPEELLSLDWER
jgi:hypothetical protein